MDWRGAACSFASAGILNQIDPGRRAAVHDGPFRMVEFHDGVVDAQASERRQQVLDRLDRGFIAHQHRLQLRQAGEVRDVGREFRCHRGPRERTGCRGPPAPASASGSLSGPNAVRCLHTASLDGGFVVRTSVCGRQRLSNRTAKCNKLRPVRLTDLKTVTWLSTAPAGTTPSGAFQCQRKHRCQEMLWSSNHSDLPATETPHDACG